MSVDLTTSAGINSLVQSYTSTEVERQINPLKTRRTGYQNISNAYQTMSTKLDALKSILSDLKNTSNTSVFSNKVATSSNNTYITASASSTASSSSYFVRVNRLAKNDALVSATKNSTETIEADNQYKFKVKIGTVEKELTIDTGGGSKSNQSLMQMVRDAINNDSDLKPLLSASVFSPTTSDSKLSFNSKNTGSNNAIILEDTQGDLLSKFGLTSSVLNDRTIMSGTNAGYVNTLTNLDSEIIFNNISITRNSNTISDIVDGVTFSLKSTMTESNPDVSINVANDSAQLKTKIEGFVSSFNDIYKYLKTNTSSNNGVRGTLYGDSSSLSLVNSLSRLAFSQVSSVESGNVNLLSQIGITFDSNNGLTVSDSSKLTTKLNDAPDQIAKLFNSSNGIATKLYDLVNPYVGASGYLTSRKNTLDKNVTEMSDKITSVQTRIDKSASSLRSQYEKLQVQLVTLINSQGVYSYY